MKVSIVVPTYNRAEYLKKCIVSLLSQEYQKGDYEIIVVDDGSTDTTSQIITELNERVKIGGGQLRYFRQINQGPSSARNYGWRNAHGKIIAFIDDDCIATPQWLWEISQGYEQLDIAGVCGNVLAAESDNIVSQFLAFEKLHQYPYYDKYGKIVYPITCNASFRKAVLESVNGFDEQFPYPGGEDVDLGIRIRKNGFFFIDNRNAIIKHYHKYTLRSLLRTWYRYGIGGSLWQMKNHARLISVKNGELENNLWIINFSESIRPYFELGKHLLRIANGPRDIARDMKKGLKLLRSIVYFSLRYMQGEMYYFGLVVGYHRYRNMFS